MAELKQLEEQGRLGVEFVEVKRGDRICERNPRSLLHIVKNGAIEDFDTALKDLDTD